MGPEGVPLYSLTSVGVEWEDWEVDGSALAVPFTPVVVGGLESVGVARKVPTIVIVTDTLLETDGLVVWERDTNDEPDTMGDGLEEKVPPLCSPPPVRDGKGEELGWLKSVGRGDIEGSARDVKVGALNFVADEQSEAPKLCVGAPESVADPLARAVPLATGGGVKERVESKVWVG